MAYKGNYNFHAGTSARFAEAIAEKTIVATDLYFLTDTRELYVGTEKYANDIFVADETNALPSKGQEGKLYVNITNNSKNLLVWLGDKYVSLLPMIADIINDDTNDSNLPTVSAIKGFITTALEGKQNTLNFDNGLVYNPETNTVSVDTTAISISYAQIEDKPKINGKTIADGNNLASDLGLATTTQLDTKVSKTQLSDEVTNANVSGSIANTLNKLSNNLTSNYATKNEVKIVSDLANNINNVELPKYALKTRVNQVEGMIPTNLAQLSNETTKYVNQDELALVRALAEGRSFGYVFDTEDEMFAYLAIEENKAKMNIGDTIYLRENQASDYWWDGTQALAIEAQSVVLGEYVTQTQFANGMDTKQDNLAEGNYIKIDDESNIISVDHLQLLTDMNQGMEFTDENGETVVKNFLTEAQIDNKIKAVESMMENLDGVQTDAESIVGAINELYFNIKDNSAQIKKNTADIATKQPNLTAGVGIVIEEDGEIHVDTTDGNLKGAKGDAMIISETEVTTLEYTEEATASIEATGEENNYKLSLGLPVGKPAVFDNKVTVTTLEPNQSASASVTVSDEDPQKYNLAFSIPQGKVGAPVTLTADYVVTDDVDGGKVDLSEVAMDGSQHVTFTVPRGLKGEKGDKGSAVHLVTGEITTGEYGSEVTGSVVKAPDNEQDLDDEIKYKLNLTIPEGKHGEMYHFHVGEYTVGTEVKVDFRPDTTDPNKIFMDFQFPRTFIQGGVCEIAPVGTQPQVWFTDVEGDVGKDSQGNSFWQKINLSLPQGEKGEKGDIGDPIYILASAETASGEAKITYLDEAGEAIDTPVTYLDADGKPYQSLLFSLPQGERGIQGIQGPPITLSLGTIETAEDQAEPAVVSIVENTEKEHDYILNMVVPRGLTGQMAKLKVGTVTKLGYDKQPTVQLTDTAYDSDGNVYTQTLNIGIPVGKPITLVKGTVETTTDVSKANLEIVKDATDDTLYTYNAVLPRGIQGEMASLKPEVLVSDVLPYEPATAEIIGDVTALEQQQLKVGIPVGKPTEFIVEEVETLRTAENPTVELTELEMVENVETGKTVPTQRFKFGLPKGDRGLDGGIKTDFDEEENALVLTYAYDVEDAIALIDEINGEVIE